MITLIKSLLKVSMEEHNKIDYRMLRVIYVIGLV